MNRSTAPFVARVLVIGLFSAAIGCDYNDSPTAPDSTAPGPEGAVITIASTGLTPNTVTITPGQSVTFVNTDSVVHEMVSTPVPTYDDCPAINRVRRLEPGQTMTTGALMDTRTCGFLDLLRTSDARWRGNITVR